VFLDVQAELGESPCWDGERSRLIWVEIEAGRVHLTDPQGSDTVVEFGPRVGAAVPRRPGGLLVARTHDAVLVDEAGAAAVFAVFENSGTWRMNDGKCDPQGRFWAGTLIIENRGEPMGQLLRLDPDRTVTRVLGEVGVSNGLAWSPDGRTMYYVDSQRQSVDAFDFDVATGTISGRRVLVEIPRAMGLPDGLTVDADGGIWLARFGGGAVDRYTPLGTLDVTIDFPTPWVTACAFGGRDLRTLFVTSDGRRGGGTHAGALFACRPGASGAAATPFAG
jgi:sugar lactone lactonase YvrE